MLHRILRRLAVVATLAFAGLPSAFAAEPRTVELQVDGLVCAFCAQGISKKLSALPATDEVLVSLEHGLVAIALKADQQLDDAQLRETLTEAGYTVRAIERTQRSLDAVRAGLDAAS